MVPASNANRGSSAPDTGDGSSSYAAESVRSPLSAVLLSGVELTTFRRSLCTESVKFEVAFFGPGYEQVKVTVFDSLDRVLDGDSVVDKNACILRKGVHWE